MTTKIFPQLHIPQTLAAGPGPGNTDPRVLSQFANAGVADHMQSDVLRGMVECKKMLRKVFGTKNLYTFGVAGTGWSGLDAMMSAVMPGDTVVAFVNGTFSSIDGLTLRMKAATENELAQNSLDPQPASVTIVNVPHGESVGRELIEKSIAHYRPKWAFMAHWETGSGRINDIQAFSDSCRKHGAMGLVDAVSSLGVEDFSIDLLQRGARTFANHPVLEARHWGIVDGKDVAQGTYHRTHSGYAVAAFHEALRLTLTETISVRASDYAYHEQALRSSLEKMGCKITSNMTSLVVFNLPDTLEGQEMELVKTCRQRGFGIWPTLSEPVQIRIGILNQLNQQAIAEIVVRFATIMNEFGAEVATDEVLNSLKDYYKIENFAESA